MVYLQSGCSCPWWERVVNGSNSEVMYIHIFPVQLSLGGH
jgi:hypothetical protein